MYVVCMKYNIKVNESLPSFIFHLIKIWAEKMLLVLLTFQNPSSVARKSNYNPIQINWYWGAYTQILNIEFIFLFFSKIKNSNTISHRSQTDFHQCYYSFIVLCDLWTFEINATFWLSFCFWLLLIFLFLFLFSYFF